MLQFLFNSIEQYGLDKTMYALMINTSILMLNQDEPYRCHHEFQRTMDEAFKVTASYFEKIPSPTISGLFRMLDEEWKDELCQRRVNTQALKALNHQSQSKSRPALATER